MVGDVGGEAVTAEQMLRKLVTEIDRNCIRTGKEGDKVLVALDQDLLDRARSVAHQQEKKPG